MPEYHAYALLTSVYAHTQGAGLLTIKSGAPKQGTHANGLYWRYFANLVTKRVSCWFDFQLYAQDKYACPNELPRFFQEVCTFFEKWREHCCCLNNKPNVMEVLRKRAESYLQVEFRRSEYGWHC